MTALGIIGAVCFSLCAVPQAWQCYRQGHARGLSWAFLGLWTVGEVATMVYVFVEHADAILLANYAANLAALLVIITYKLRPVVRLKSVA